ncbi:hypothetical protein ABEW24_20220 [Paenibacillus jamilae]|uniref:hypothetical protein n=1 Tax=Paenibacillus TaxID=44249 RepID=UPI000A75B100|nr:hypothetical protein [Paenibacillus polymyxa]
MAQKTACNVLIPAFRPGSGKECPIRRMSWPTDVEQVGGYLTINVTEVGCRYVYGIIL